MSRRVEVGPAADLPPGEREILSVAGRQVGVFNVEGDFYAVENDCCHDHGPVCKGRVHDKLVADVDEESKEVTERIGDEPSIACPWHGYEYDLETGVHLGVDDIALETFEVIEDDGTVYVRVEE